MAILLPVTFGIVLLAAFAQAVSGFGYALLAVPLLTLASDPRTAVVVASVTGVGLTVTSAARERAHARWRTALLLTSAAVLGMPVGLLVLTLAPARLLTVLIAVVVLGCTVLVWRRVRFRTGPAVVAAVGVFSGVLATSTGMNGPPLVAAFQALGYDPRTFRATLAAAFAGSGVLGLAGFVLAGQVDAATLRLAAAGLPAVLLGWWLGDRIFARVNLVVFRRIVLLGLVAMSAAALVQALTG
ncbi:sulfite exporter TauE/SafE family protein [Plantactinospora sp. KBS50]|uniref:sulfite exporter TauE/SafE family protein n=1 Tax=Plantactinospora sp. KBS50 TaxID=2024580 RepID=UPI0012FE7B78|nr:sulfite exporter TauE/SafE family protein [Plantactinospora sp. KBS50]